MAAPATSGIDGRPPCVLLPPLYDLRAAKTLTQVHPSRVRRGAVIVVEAHRARKTGEEGSLTGYLPELCTTWCECPTIILSRDSNDGLVQAANLALGHHGVMAVARPGDVHPEFLRQILPFDSGHAPRVAHWLNRRAPLARSSHRLLDSLIRIGAHHNEVDGSLYGVLHQLALSQREANASLARDGLPTLVGVLRIGLSLAVAGQIQRNPCVSFDSVAAHFGWSTTSSINHLFERVFKVTPSEVRRTIGWQWLLARALDFPEAKME